VGIGRLEINWPAFSSQLAELKFEGMKAFRGTIALAWPAPGGATNTPMSWASSARTACCWTAVNALAGRSRAAVARGHRHGDPGRSLRIDYRTHTVSRPPVRRPSSTRRRAQGNPDARRTVSSDPRAAKRPSRPSIAGPFLVPNRDCEHPFHGQRSDCRTTDRGQIEDLTGVIGNEVVAPCVEPGMEQLCGIAGCWIDGRRTCSFPQRTRHAREQPSRPS
jgi:hypothetical protein